MRSTSTGCRESNTSHTVSARRNNAAGVAAANAKVMRSASLSRLAVTVAGPAPTGCVWTAGGACAAGGKP
jgi:hypothetical protein